MDREQEIYKLIVEDIFMVIEDNEMDIKIEESDILFIEEKVGEIIDWRSAIEIALWELKNKKAEKV
jgi:hypothetical protein